MRPLVPNEPEALETERSPYVVSLPNLAFEGPLDLLLSLIQKHELNILDLPIAFVTEKYLEYLAMMELIELDLAAEYLVMAATLVHIKSKMLLPQPPPGQDDDPLVEEEDPREALIRRLLEYQKYKHVAKELAEKGLASQNTFLRGVRIEEAVHTGLPPLADVPLFRLLEAFQGVLDRTKVKLTHDIVADRISITDRIHELSTLLRERKRIIFAELFEGIVSRFDLVITFLALLEMTKLRMTRLTQTDPDSPIYVDVTAAFGESIDDNPFDDGRAAVAEAAARAASVADAAEGESTNDSATELTTEDAPRTTSDRASATADDDLPRIQGNEPEPQDEMALNDIADTGLPEFSTSDLEDASLQDLSASDIADGADLGASQTRLDDSNEGDDANDGGDEDLDSGGPTPTEEPS